MTPEIPNDARKKRQFLSTFFTWVKTAQKNIENRIGTFWVSGFNMYSNKMCNESFDVETEDKDGEKYNIKIDFKFEVDL